MGIIVVGVDGSDSSRAALAWALAEARLRGSSVRAVHAWMLPAMGAGEAPWALIPPGSYVDVDTEEIEKATHEALDREIAEVGGPAGVAVERFVAEGPAADVIVEASADAELIVVGTRGRGAIATLVLGSTSQQVIHNAKRPVVVVPAPDA
jgi:nucleotide-binding universal stress UspA family protein